MRLLTGLLIAATAVSLFLLTLSALPAWPEAQTCQRAKNQALQEQEWDKQAAALQAEHAAHAEAQRLDLIALFGPDE